MSQDSRTRSHPKGSVSGRYVASGSCVSVPRVTLSSFGRSKFTWCLQEAWGDDDFAQYLAFSQNSAWNPFRRLECVSPKMRNMALPVGKWLLKEDIGRVVAAAEVLAAETGFSKVTVNVSLADDIVDYKTLSESVSYFVTAMFLITSADLIVFALPGGNLQELISAMTGADSGQIGELRQVRAVRSEIFLGGDDWSLPLMPMDFWEVSSADWWNAPSTKKDFEDLKYLQKRIEIEQRRAELASGLRRKRPRVSLFSRLFGRR